MADIPCDRAPGRPHLYVVPPDGEQLAARWVDWIDTVDPGVGDRVADAATDVAEALVEHPASLLDDLERLGREAGREGWPLPAVSRWLDRLAVMAGHGPHQALHSWEAGVAVGQGWTTGITEGAAELEVFDPDTGLATAAVLAARLDEVYAEAAARDTTPSGCLLVLRIPRDASAIQRAVVARRVQDDCRGGELVCMLGTVIVALTPPVADPAARLDRLHTAVLHPGDPWPASELHAEALPPRRAEADRVLDRHAAGR